MGYFAHQHLSYFAAKYAVPQWPCEAVEDDHSSLSPSKTYSDMLKCTTCVTDMALVSKANNNIIIALINQKEERNLLFFYYFFLEVSIRNNTFNQCVA